MAAFTRLADGTVLRWHADLGESARQRVLARIIAEVVAEEQVQAQFRAKVEAFIDRTTTCWLWTGARSPNGYGKWNTSYAHRVSYEIYVGPIPEGLTIDHLCRVKLCVNPSHLEAVTQGENNRRAWTTRTRPTHCRKGHPLIQLSTQRRCPVCRVERDRQRSGLQSRTQAS